MHITTSNKVLILVVVEDVLVLVRKYTSTVKDSSLNPCCGGRCSSTFMSKVLPQPMVRVLILVVVEDVLVHVMGIIGLIILISLNPCCGGRCSSTYCKNAFNLYLTKS